MKHYTKKLYPLPLKVSPNLRPGGAYPAPDSTPHAKGREQGVGGNGFMGKLQRTLFCFQNHDGWKTGCSIVLPSSIEGPD